MADPDLPGDRPAPIVPPGLEPSADQGTLGRSDHSSGHRASGSHRTPRWHVAIAAVFLDKLVDVIAALAVALGAFDAEHVELAFDVAEDEIGAGPWNPTYCV